MGEMRIRQSFRLCGFLTLSASVAFGACGGEPSPDDVSETEAAIESTNALSANALSANALSANALSANALSANALSANALSANALTATALRDPLARQFLKYVVSCALPPDARLVIGVDGTSYSFTGELGLAPEWGAEHGACDGDCQRWVSACVLARVDYAGVKRLISLRGDHRALRASARELRDYPVREATYYGNLFAEGQTRFLCLSPGQSSDERVCGPSLTSCPMTVMGSCASACRHMGPQGSFVDCAVAPSRARQSHCEDDDGAIHHTVTVYLPPSSSR